MAKNSEETLKEKYMQFQILDQQIKQVKQQSEALEKQLNDLNTVIESLEEVKNLKPGDEILVPMNNGIFMKANIKDSKDLIINVGANTAVKKPVGDVKKLLKKQASDIKEISDKFNKELQNMTKKAAILGTEINELIEKNKGE